MKKVLFKWNSANFTPPMDGWMDVHFGSWALTLPMGWDRIYCG